MLPHEKDIGTFRFVLVTHRSIESLRAEASIFKAKAQDLTPLEVRRLDQAVTIGLLKVAEVSPWGSITYPELQTYIQSAIGKRPLGRRELLMAMEAIAGLVIPMMEAERRRRARVLREIRRRRRSHLSVARK